MNDKSTEEVAMRSVPASLEQLVDYGGELVTVGSLYETEGDAFAGAWLAGYWLTHDEGADLTHADLELVDPLAGWSS